MPTRSISMIALALSLAAAGSAQDAARLIEDPAVKEALAAVKRNETHFIEEQIRICEIPAPPFHEEARARELERLFQQLGLRDVRIDKAGNAIGVRPGAAAASQPAVSGAPRYRFPGRDECEGDARGRRSNRRRRLETQRGLLLAVTLAR